jgi:hypothetical protein
MFALFNWRSNGLELTTGHNNIPETVPRIEPTQSFCTLGVYIAGSSKQTKQATVLRAHSDHYKESLHKAYMSPPETYWSYILFLRTNLNYPLPACSVAQKQCRAIQAPALAALLPKLHLNCHSPRAVLFGGLRYGGLDLPELYTDQGYGQLKLLIGHLKLRDEVCLQILYFLWELQLFIGSHKPVFSLSFPVYGRWVGEYWLVSIWKHLSQIDFFLEVEDSWRPALPRQFDEAVMDLAVRLTGHLGSVLCYGPLGDYSSKISALEAGFFRNWVVGLTPHINSGNGIMMHLRMRYTIWLS